MLGLSKLFVFILFLSVVLGYASRDWMKGVYLLIIFIMVRVGWRFLTMKR